jgi:hypothetical protein
VRVWSDHARPQKVTCADLATSALDGAERVVGPPIKSQIRLVGGKVTSTRTDAFHIRFPFLNIL